MEARPDNKWPEDITKLVDGTIASLIFPVGAELDVHGGPVILDAVNGTLQDPAVSHLVIDISNVVYIDSTVLGVFISGLKLSESLGKSFTIDNSRGDRRVHKLFQITSLLEIFDYLSPEEAG